MSLILKRKRTVKFSDDACRKKIKRNPKLIRIGDEHFDGCPNEIVLYKSPFKFGRHPGKCDKVLNAAINKNLIISREHAELRKRGSHWYVKHLSQSSASKINGTFVNGRKLEGQNWSLVQDGACVIFGPDMEANPLQYIFHLNHSEEISSKIESRNSRIAEAQQLELERKNVELEQKEAEIQKLQQEYQRSKNQQKEKEAKDQAKLSAERERIRKTLEKKEMELQKEKKKNKMRFY